MLIYVCIGSLDDIYIAAQDDIHVICVQFSTVINSAVKCLRIRNKRSTLCMTQDSKERRTSVKKFDVYFGVTYWYHLYLSLDQRIDWCYLSVKANYIFFLHFIENASFAQLHMAAARIIRTLCLYTGTYWCTLPRVHFDALEHFFLICRYKKKKKKTHE